MNTLTERLNFSNDDENSTAIEIKKWGSVNHYETLCLYLADNNVCGPVADDTAGPLSAIDALKSADEDFDAAVMAMQEYGQSDKTTASYFFWIS